MNIKKWLILTFLVTVKLLSSNAIAESSVWKVSKGGNYFYLGGTIHLLTAADHPLPKEFSVAYNEASVVIFETDLTAAQTPEFQSRLMSSMTYNDSRRLNSELKAETYNQLQQYLLSRQIPITTFENFQPWGVSLMITMLEYQRLGMMPNYGVDPYFHRLAIADGKIVMSLETPEEQLNVLSSMSNVDPDKGVEYTLIDLERMPQFIADMKSNWRIGDIDAFSRMDSVIDMQTKFPGMYERLVTRRNNAWMEKLPYLVDDSPIELVLVGALHLSGPEGLLDQLESNGFVVNQM